MLRMGPWVDCATSSSRPCCKRSNCVPAPIQSAPRPVDVQGGDCLA